MTLITAAATAVAALSLDGLSLSELLVDHGNGTVHFWTEDEHPNVNILTTNIVNVVKVSEALKQENISKFMAEGLGQTFCDGIGAQDPDSLYGKAAPDFCSDLHGVKNLYFAAAFDIFTGAECVNGNGSNFAYGFLFDVVQQAIQSTIGAEVELFCLSAFDTIHNACQANFGGLDRDITETNGKSGQVECRANAVDKGASSCKSFQNPTPRRLFQCKVRSL
ncbi:hypothetical protein PT974_02853 [Cladobotryum mycophilum]|uniref:Uncharacterized protein n=1 Tax=Cladobotryum mycophilum TaxID=491253 RepID=A0ABR0T0G0_9HYPO